MMSMEQPKYSPVLANLKYLEANIDLMVTYSLADVYPGTSVPNMVITYWPLNIVSPQAVLQPARPFVDKTGYDTGIYPLQLLPYLILSHVSRQYNTCSTVQVSLWRCSRPTARRLGRRIDTAIWRS